MLHRDPERLRKLRIAIRYLLHKDALQRGHQSRLAEHFNVSRQRVHQVVNDEQQRRAREVRVRAARMAQLQPPAQAAITLPPSPSFDAPSAPS